MKRPGAVAEQMEGRKKGGRERVMAGGRKKGGRERVMAGGKQGEWRS